MLIIDKNSVLSSFDKKCTLLQAINTLNDNLDTLAQRYVGNLAVLPVDPTTTPTREELGNIWFNYEDGTLFQVHLVTGGSTPVAWEQVFKFARAK